METGKKKQTFNKLKITNIYLKQNTQYTGQRYIIDYVIASEKTKNLVEETRKYYQTTTTIRQERNEHAKH